MVSNNGNKLKIKQTMRLKSGIKYFAINIKIQKHLPALSK